MVLSMEVETGLVISDAIPEHGMVVSMDLGFVGYFDLLRQPHDVFFRSVCWSFFGFLGGFRVGK